MSLRFAPLAALGFLVLSPAWAAPADALPPADGYVVDTAGVVSTEVEERLEVALADLKTRTGHELAVAVVDSLEGATVEEYARALFDQWGVGRAAENDGALLVLAIQERRSRIEVGEGLRDRLTDDVAATVLRDEVAPRLRSGDFDGGVSAGVIGMRRAIGDDVRSREGGPPVEPVADEVPVGRLIGPGEPDDVTRLSPGFGTFERDSSGAPFAMAAAFAVVLSLVSLVLKFSDTGSVRSQDDCPNCGRAFPLRHRHHALAGARMFDDTCVDCGFTRMRAAGRHAPVRQVVASPGWSHGRDIGWFGGGSSSGDASSSWSSSSAGSNDSSSGSSSSSFGGGSSAGGGASGSW